MDAARLDGPKRASASAAGGVSYGPPKKAGGATAGPVGIPSGTGGAVRSLLEQVNLLVADGNAGWQAQRGEAAGEGSGQESSIWAAAEAAGAAARF